jgi:peptidoglycan/LPS O-acetylase OafA/YrhL
MGEAGPIVSEEAQGGRIAAIQLLRALAALVMAAGHIAFAFADHLPGGLGLAPDDGRAGQTAVMLFFVVSGYVMVVSSERLFGQPGARRTFWTRRFVRIMPPYWIATGVLALIFVTLFPQPVDLARLAQSLVLPPYWTDDASLRPVPFLWAGWTLFFEMMFYALFALLVVWRREIAVAGVIAVLCVMVAAGTQVPPINALLFSATRPITLVFAAGMILALRRARGGVEAPWLRWAALAAIVPALWLAPVPPTTWVMGFDYLYWAALPAALLAFVALFGPLALPAARIVNRAGDASYALYLLHVPVAWFWLWFWGRLPFFDAGPWDYCISALAGAVAVSWLFHVHVERPMTLALNRWLAAPHRAEALSRKTP